MLVVVFLSPSPPVILSNAKDLVFLLRTNSAKNQLLSIGYEILPFGQDDKIVFLRTHQDGFCSRPFTRQ